MVTVLIMQLSESGDMSFIGQRHKTKDDIKLKIYQAEIKVKTLSVVFTYTIHSHSWLLSIEENLREDLLHNHLINIRNGLLSMKKK